MKTGGRSRLMETVFFGSVLLQAALLPLSAVHAADKKHIPFLPVGQTNPS